MAAKEKEKILNVPNVLTIIRALLIPVYWYLFMNDHRYAALAVFIVASLTDLADGYIARKYNLVTNFGKLMDPLADKLMVISVMLSLAIKGIVPWPVLIILLAKEGIMVLGGAFMLKQGVVVYAKWIGKAAQATVVCALLSCFFHEWLRDTLGFPLHLVLLWIGVALTLTALVMYGTWAIKQYQDVKKG